MYNSDTRGAEGASILRKMASGLRANQAKSQKDSKARNNQTRKSRQKDGAITSKERRKKKTRNERRRNPRQNKARNKPKQPTKRSNNTKQTNAEKGASQSFQK